MLNRLTCTCLLGASLPVFIIKIYGIYNSFSFFFSSQIYHMVLQFDFFTGMYLTVVYLHVPFVYKII